MGVPDLFAIQRVNRTANCEKYKQIVLFEKYLQSLCMAKL